MDPYDYYRDLRATDPVHWNAALNLWTLTQHADIATALRHPDLSSGRPQPSVVGLGAEARDNASIVYGTIATWLLRLDPPAHTLLRRICAPALRACITGSTRARIEQAADELLDRVAPTGGMDVIDDFAAPLSLDAIATIVGVPTADHDRFFRWANAVGAAAEAAPDPTRLQAAARSLSAANDYLRQLVAERTDHPEHDLLSALLRADLHGERLGTTTARERHP